MARRAIVVRLSDEESAFHFSRVDRAKLYGSKERVILDERGERCVAAFLTPDGAALVPPGGTAHLYVDERFETIDRSALRAVDESGQPVAPRESTLGVPQPLARVEASRILDHVIVGVYQLTAESLAPDLEAALKEGAIFTAPYRYGRGYEDGTLFLLSNDEGLFGLVGREAGFTYLAREVTPALAGADDEADALDDDLDFSMM